MGPLAVAVIGAAARQGMTMLCVTHEMGFAKAVANRVKILGH